MNINTTYIIITSTLAIILLVIVIFLISIIVYPKKPIEYLKKVFHLNPNANQIFEDATSYEDFTYLKMTHKIFYLEKDNTTGTIIIDIPGGAFLSSSNTFVQYLDMKQPHTVVSIEYPTLPTGKMSNAISYLTKAIQHVIDKYSNPKIILCAYSAGCFYGTKIINSGKFKNIIKFISTSGYFGYKTMENLATLIADKFYLRQLSSSTLNDCLPISNNIRTMFCVGEFDPLKESTILFLRQSGAENEIIQYPNSDHCFYLRYNNDITKDFYNDVAEFINN
ncbi:hypothetical protein CsNV_088 [Callinectes sapidus nudivirus]|nr:hypothetical protein CsNV_088 [Callinectes sapidus nudivirus]